jgi:hypothetical protein
LLDSLRAGGHTDTGHLLLQREEEYEDILWKIAFSAEKVQVLKIIRKYLDEEHRDWSKLGVLQKMCEWPKENQTREEQRSKIILDRDDWGRTVWYLAVNDGKVDVLQKIMEWAKENLTEREIKIRWY